MAYGDVLCSLSVSTKLQTKVDDDGTGVPGSFSKEVCQEICAAKKNPLVQFLNTFFRYLSPEEIKCCNPNPTWLFCPIFYLSLFTCSHSLYYICMSISSRQNLFKTFFVDFRSLQWPDTLWKITGSDRNECLPGQSSLSKIYKHNKWYFYYLGKVCYNYFPSFENVVKKSISLFCLNIYGR